MINIHGRKVRARQDTTVGNTHPFQHLTDRKTDTGGWERGKVPQKANPRWLLRKHREG
jgi:hypothetical protein